MKTIHEAAAALREGTTTPVDLVEQCLTKIEQWEARVKAWVLIDRDGARSQARRLGDELKRGPRRSPLHGIPIAIKDIFDVADWPTAAGSKLWANAVAREDAELVLRLREAGAIFLGKTVTTAYASFDPPVTRNPWNTQQTPGGSSSGSAAALVTGMCLGAMGSQTGGSITRPASYCGVAGYKPAYGVLPCDGVMALAPTMDHPGPMARCVRDLGLMFQVLTPESPNYEALLSKRPPSPRLGRVRGLFEELAAPSVNDMMDDVHKRLAKHTTITEIVLPSAFGEVIANHRVIMAVEGAEYHRVRLERHPEDYPPKIRELLDEGLRYPAVAYRHALEQRQRLIRAMADCFSEVDALLTPATTGPAPDAGSTGNPAFNSPWSFTGLPTVSFPTGHFADGLPLAIQLVGDSCAMNLLETALWCEQTLDVTPLEPKLPAR